MRGFGQDRAYQKVGHEDKAHLFKHTLTLWQVPALLPGMAMLAP